jgi:hypothetical protein
MSLIKNIIRRILRLKNIYLDIRNNEKFSYNMRLCLNIKKKKKKIIFNKKKKKKI